MARRHVLLAGGGTGGHIFPALALADELLRRGWAVSFAGSAQGLEARLVPERGIPFHSLAARPLLGRGPIAQGRALWTAARSALQARRLVQRLGAQVIVGTGGYVSAPAVLGACLARRPVLLFEPNARPGAANRWLSRFAAEAAVAFPQAARELHCRSQVVGVPVRTEFFAVPEEPPGAPAPSLLILGGSQGARALNRDLPPAMAEVATAFSALHLIHQAGERRLEETRAAYAAAGLSESAARITPFIADVAGAMGAADLVIARAGAVTIAEICAAGRAALLLPLGIAAGHQVDNARALVEAGAARMLVPEEASSRGIAAAVAAMLGDRAELRRMARAARGLARPGAAAALADRVAALAERPC